MKVLNKISIFGALCACAFLHGLPTASPAFAYPTELYPPQDLQAKVKAVIADVLIDKFTDVNGAPDVLQDLQAAGFKILQYLPNDSKSAVVVEHPSVPGYVIKFSRTPDIVMHLVKRGASQVRWSDLRLRVENARKLQQLIADNGISTVIVPKKYLMYVNKFPLVIAQKVAIPEQKPLREMTQQQIRDLLLLEKESKGVLDLKPKNIIFDGAYIYLIDTERVEQPSLGKLKSILEPSVLSFKKVINPQYVSCVDEWFDNLDKKDAPEPACLRSRL